MFVPVESGLILDECARVSETLVETLGIDGYCRFDFIWSKDRLFLLEVNSHASLKPHGAMFKSMSFAGYSNSDFLKSIINTSLK